MQPVTDSKQTLLAEAEVGEVTAAVAVVVAAATVAAAAAADIVAADSAAAPAVPACLNIKGVS